MFEIDLLTKTGLQKAIQKTNFDKNKKKQKIKFFSKENIIDGSSNTTLSISDNLNIFSILIFSILVLFLVFLGFFNMSNSIKVNDFLPNTRASQYNNEYENVLSTITKIFGNSDNSISLSYLELSDNLVIKMNIDSTDKIKYLDANSLFSYKIYDSNYGYKVQLYYPIKNWTNDSFDSEMTLTNLVKYYKNDHNVKMQMDNESIYFTTTNKATIIRIFETLMFSGNILIYPDEATISAYNLVYSY